MEETDSACLRLGFYFPLGLARSQPLCDLTVCPQFWLVHRLQVELPEPSASFLYIHSVTSHACSLHVDACLYHRRFWLLKRRSQAPCVREETSEERLPPQSRPLAVLSSAWNDIEVLHFWFQPLGCSRRCWGSWVPGALILNLSQPRLLQTVVELHQTGCRCSLPTVHLHLLLFFWSGNRDLRRVRGALEF